MAPTLHTVAQCLEIPLGDDSLINVVEREKENVLVAPFYEVSVSKSKVHLKPTGKDGKKLKRLDIKKANEMHIDERSNAIALSVPQKREKSLCLDLKFNDSNSRKEFQTLARTINSQLTVTQTKSAINSGSVAAVKSDTYRSQARSYLSTETPQKIYDLLSGWSSAPGGRSTWSSRRNRRPPSSLSETDLSPVCSHCHQTLSKRYKSIEVEYLPRTLASWSSDEFTEIVEPSMKNTYVIYAGPNQTNGEKPPRETFTNERNRENSGDRHEFSTVLSSTTTLENDRGMNIGTVICKSPVPSKRPVVSRIKKTSHRKSERAYSGYRPPAVFYIWDSSSDEGNGSDYNAGDESIFHYNGNQSSDSTEYEYLFQPIKHERMSQYPRNFADVRNR